MAWPEIPPLIDRGFRAVTTLGDACEVRLAGSADIAAVEPLEGLIAKVHAAMLENGAREIVVDIQALEFMSATCFNVLVQWISTIQDVEESRRYSLRIRSNPKIPWQRRSLQTLACFATNLVTLL
jgi:anti-anti-sigma factor